jgi:hypothetical protein
MSNSRPSIVTGTFSTMDAIQSLVVDVEFYITTDPEDTETITWVNPTVAPVTSEEIEAEKARLLTEWTANEYARNRSEAYDSVGNQLDMLMKDMRDGTTTHQTACEAVKAKYPKPE